MKVVNTILRRPEQGASPSLQSSSLRQASMPAGVPSSSPSLRKPLLRAPPPPSPLPRQWLPPLPSPQSSLPLPPPPPNSPPSPPSLPTPESAADHERDVAAFFGHLERLQNPPDCRTAPLYVFKPTKYTSGIGSQLRVIANSMLQSVALNRTFVLDVATSTFVHPRRCKSRRYDCLFEPTSRCTLADAVATGDVVADAATIAALPANGSAPFGWLESLPSWDSSSGKSPPSIADARVVLGRASCYRFEPTRVPLVGAAWAAAAAHGRPTGWFITQVFRYLARPNHDLQRLTAKLASRMGLDSGEPYGAMHIRRLTGRI